MSHKWAQKTKRMRRKEQWQQMLMTAVRRVRREKKTMRTSEGRLGESLLEL